MNQNPTDKRSKLALLLTVFGLLALPALGEIALRVTGFRHPRANERIQLWNAERDDEIRSKNGLYEFDTDLIWKLRPGAVLPWTTGERVNPDGYRGPQLSIERPLNKVRIAMLGGAGTLGLGVRWEDTYSARLVQLLRERGIDAEVLDAGVPDYSIRQQLERWRTLVQPYHPNVVICTFLGNMGHQQAYGSLTDDQKIRLLRSLPDGGRTHSCVRCDMRLCHLASWLGDLCSGEYWREREARLDEMRMTKTYGELEWPGVRRVPTQDFENDLDDICDETFASKARMIVVSIPKQPSAPQPPVYSVYEQALANWADRRKIHFLDMRNAYLSAVQSEDIDKDDLFTEEGLPSECGHLQIAKSLAEEIVERIERSHAR